MSYERGKGHGVGRLRLPSRDSSRFSTLSLVIHRSSTGKGVCSLIVRSVGGGVLQDTRLGTVTIDLAPGSEASQDPRVALQAALDAFLFRR
jgi:hypothetical protein